jgi:biopolymer transport protein ExbD
MHSERKQDRPPVMNMTSMIDVVFLLVIFFMIVTDISQQELEALKLPRADMAEKDQHPQERRMVININREGHFIVRRRDEGEVGDCLDRIRVQLSLEADAAGRGSDGASKKPVLIRADEGTEFSHIQKVMQLCGEERVKIHKVDLGCSRDTTKEDPP